jgi:catechol 2,3-dioxygenase-like lactoylglutathione lyase family enzyme
VKQPIVGYHQDDEGHWVAELRCGHGQHVRHDPPWQLRPWVVTAEGRAAHIDLELECLLCERGAMLDSAKLVAFGATSRAAEASRFYRDALGLRLRSEDDYALVFDANGVELRLQKVATVKPQPFTMLGWQVPDLDALLDTLGRRGVRCERFPGMGQDARGVWRAPSGARVAWFKDPDGNILSAAQYPDG